MTTPGSPLQFTELAAFFYDRKSRFMAEWMRMDYVTRCELVRDVATVLGRDPVMITGADVYSMARAIGTSRR